jgi:hypothetical protein
MTARPPCPPDNVVTLPVIRIIPEPDGGGWLVIFGSYGWLHGSRQAALEDKRWLDTNLRGRA